MSAVLKLPVVQMSGVDEGSDLYIQVTGNFAVYGLARIEGQPAVSVLTTEVGTWQILAEPLALTEIVVASLYREPYTCMSLGDVEVEDSESEPTPSGEAGRE